MGPVTAAGTALAFVLLAAQGAVARAPSATKRAERSEAATPAAADPRRLEDPFYEPPRETPPENPSVGFGFGRAPRATPDLAELGFDEPERLEGAALKARVPDLVLRDQPQPISIGVGLFSHVPFQVAGLGLSLQARPVPFLRAHVHYSGGLVLRRDKGELGSYAEAALGVRVFETRTTRDYLVYPEVPRHWHWFWGYRDGTKNEKGEPQAPDFRAVISADHAVFLEGGVLTGPIYMLTCIQRCEPNDGTRSQRRGRTHQFVFPFAGIRYEYFAYAFSERRRNASRRIRWEFFAHAIREPFSEGNPNATQWGADSTLRRDAFGGRAGASIPACLTGHCPNIEVVLGYTPLPGTVILEFGIGPPAR